MIDFIDNFLPNEKYNSILEYCLNAPFYYGERDLPGAPPVGMTSEISSEKNVYNLLKQSIQEKISLVKDLEIKRMYINCFAPHECPYYHTDGESGITFIYYINPNVSINNGGETKFMFENKSINILPIPNRLLFFDANILHKATSFNNQHRFTIAIKYN